MPRAFRGRPDVYFGRPGYLSKLPWPRGGMEKSYDRPVFEFATGSGQRQISNTVFGSRPYTLTWNAGHMDTFQALEQYWVGAMGTGPWVLIDPSMANMCLPNFASASCSTYDTRDWKSDSTANGTPVSNSDPEYIHRTGAPRSMRWNFTTAPGVAPTLYMANPYRHWFGSPVVGGLAYTWSFWIRNEGGPVADVQAIARMQWLRASGFSVGISSSTTTTFGFWTRISVTATAPSDAAFVVPQIVGVQATLASGRQLYIDEPILEQDSVLNAWAPGTGLRPVEILSLSDSVPFDARFRTGTALTLRELAA